MKALILLLAICGTILANKNCCEEGQIMRKGGYCGDNTERKNLNCTFGHMLLTDAIVKGDKLSTKDSPGFIFAEDPSQYCLGKMYENETQVPLKIIDVAVVCFQAADKPNDFEKTGILTLISVVFLILTFIVYCFLPELRDLQGKCYMSLCLSMALGFLSLGVSQLSPGFSEAVCTMNGFMIYVWMMATFFWMNVICINVYRTIVDAAYLKKTERKQFFIYSGYAWGMTLIFFIVSLITNFVEGDHYKPGFGNHNCWFHGRAETWIFFYGPIALLVFTNVVLFVLSSFSLWRDARRYEVTTMNNLKYRFCLSLKLLLVMGISWIFEIASFAHNRQHIIWEITDTFNCLQGLVIFTLLVVLRKRVMLGLVRAGICIGLARKLGRQLSPHDESCDQQMIEEDNTEITIN